MYVVVFLIVYHKGCLVNMPFHCRESASCGNYRDIKLSVWIITHLTKQHPGSFLKHCTCANCYVHIETSQGFVSTHLELWMQKLQSHLQVFHVLKETKTKTKTKKLTKTRFVHRAKWSLICPQFNLNPLNNRTTKFIFWSVQGSQQLGNSEKKRAGERAKKKTHAGRSR